MNKEVEVNAENKQYWHQARITKACKKVNHSEKRKPMMV